MLHVRLSIMNWECNKCSWLFFTSHVELFRIAKSYGSSVTIVEREKYMRFERMCNKPLVFKSTVWKVWNQCSVIPKMEFDKYLTPFLCPQCHVSKESLDIVLLLQSLVTINQKMREAVPITYTKAEEVPNAQSWFS